jgi:acyl dehydratase
MREQYFGVTNADKDEMLDYARQNDPSPFHVDEEAARNSPYGGLIASAGYTVTLLYRSAIPILASIAFLGGFDWHIKLPLPLRPGDRLRTEVEIRNKTSSSKSGRGYVTTLHRILNQDSQVVFTCEAVWMIATKPRASDPLRCKRLMRRSGGNLTGITFDPWTEIWGKRLQMLKEAIPSTAKVAFWVCARNGKGLPGKSCGTLAIDAESLVFMLPQKGASSEIERVFAAMEQQRPDVVLVSGKATYTLTAS